MKRSPANTAVIFLGLALVFYAAMGVFAFFSAIPLLPLFFLGLAGSLTTGIVLGVIALKRERNTRNRIIVAAGLVMVAALLFIHGRPVRFDPRRWNLRDRNDYPVLRAMMVDDLMKNRLRAGMTHDQVVELLGDSVAVVYRRTLDKPASGAADSLPGTMTPRSVFVPAALAKSGMDGEFSMIFALPDYYARNESAPKGGKILVVEFTEKGLVDDFRLKEWDSSVEMQAILLSIFITGSVPVEHLLDGERRQTSR